MSNFGFQLTTQGLNAIFDAFFEGRPVVFWIRTSDWRHQVYVSKKYEDLWGHPVDQIFQHPFSWRECIAAPNRKEQEQVWNKCMVNQRCLVYAIQHPEKGMRWIRDANFPLYDTEQRLIGYAGLAEDVTHELESNDIKIASAVADATLNPQYKMLIDILVRELRVSPTQVHRSPLDHIVAERPIIVNGLTALLSPREVECVKRLHDIGSAKLVARELNISFRTVEKHIENVKQKLHCSSRTEMMNQLTGAIV